MTLKVSDLYCKVIPAALFISCILLSPAFSQGDTISTDPEVISAGEQLFRQNCQTCHRVHEPLIGPALANVYDRRDLSWIQAFVRNSLVVIQSGDEYANDLYDEYNQTQMTPFDFTDGEINSIIAYVKDQTDNPAVADVAGSDGTGGPAVDGLVIPITYLNLIQAGMILTLIMFLTVLAMIARVMRK